MGLMMRRRRPVMRMAAGAAVAGTAYHMGKSNQQQAQVNEQAQEAYAATQQAPAPAPQYAPPPPAPAPAAPAAGGTADLDHLVELHNSGALSDEEFSAAKAKLLGI
jgi:glucose/arabinose dehydrogenase